MLKHVVGADGMHGQRLKPLTGYTYNRKRKYLRINVLEKKTKTKQKSNCIKINVSIAFLSNGTEHI